MAEGITQNQLADGIVVTRTISRTLNNTEMKALPTTGIVILPATDTPNYGRKPTSIPVLQSAVIAGTGPAGYSNVDAASYAFIAYGSDWSFDASLKFRVSAAAGLFENTGTPLDLLWNVPGVSQFHLASGYVHYERVAAGFYDNALIIRASNASAGDFTGGDEDNELVVTLNYIDYIP